MCASVQCGCVWVCLVAMHRVWSDVCEFVVVACVGAAVCVAWCVSCRGVGHGVMSWWGVSVGCVFGDGFWVPLAIFLGAGVGMGDELLMVSWGGVSVCGMLCGVGCARA